MFRQLFDEIKDAKYYAELALDASEMQNITLSSELKEIAHTHMTNAHKARKLFNENAKHLDTSSFFAELNNEELDKMTNEVKDILNSISY